VTYPEAAPSAPGAKRSGAAAAGRGEVCSQQNAVADLLSREPAQPYALPTVPSPVTELSSAIVASTTPSAAPSSAETTVLFPKHSSSSAKETVPIPNYAMKDANYKVSCPGLSLRLLLVSNAVLKQLTVKHYTRHHPGKNNLRFVG